MREFITANQEIQRADEELQRKRCEAGRIEI